MLYLSFESPFLGVASICSFGLNSFIACKRSVCADVNIWCRRKDLLDRIGVGEMGENMGENIEKKVAKWEGRPLGIPFFSSTENHQNDSSQSLLSSRACLAL